MLQAVSSRGTRSAPPTKRKSNSYDGRPYQRDHRGVDRPSAVRRAFWRRSGGARLRRHCHADDAPTQRHARPDARREDRADPAASRSKPAEIACSAGRVDCLARGRFQPEVRRSVPRPERKFRRTMAIVACPVIDSRMTRSQDAPRRRRPMAVRVDEESPWRVQPSISIQR